MSLRPQSPLTLDHFRTPSPARMQKASHFPPSPISPGTVDDISSTGSGVEPFLTSRTPNPSDFRFSSHPRSPPRGFSDLSDLGIAMESEPNQSLDGNRRESAAFPGSPVSSGRSSFSSAPPSPPPRSSMLVVRRPSYHHSRTTPFPIIASSPSSISSIHSLLNDGSHSLDITHRPFTSTTHPYSAPSYFQPRLIDASSSDRRHSEATIGSQGLGMAFGQGQEPLGRRTPLSRTTKACDACRAKKVRCDGESEGKGRCGRCVETGAECGWNNVPKRRGPAPGTTKAKHRRPSSISSLASLGIASPPLTASSLPRIPPASPSSFKFPTSFRPSSSGSSYAYAPAHSPSYSPSSLGPSTSGHQSYFPAMPQPFVANFSTSSSMGRPGTSGGVGFQGNGQPIGEGWTSHWEDFGSVELAPLNVGIGRATVELD